EVALIADAAGMQDTPRVIAAKQFAEHGIVRGFTGASAEEDHGVAVLHRIERVVSGELVVQVEPGALFKGEEQRRQRRDAAVWILAHEHHVELDEVSLRHIAEMRRLTL